MIKTELTSLFILELLKYADVEDLNMLLEISNSKLHTAELTDVPESSKHQINLIYQLMFPILMFVQQNYGIIPAVPKQTLSESCLSLKDRLNELLLLHITALCSFYYSYPIERIDILEDSFTSMKRECKNLKNQFKSSMFLPPTDKKKILHLLINCYAQNGFYYSFSDNQLEKIEIIETSLRERKSVITKYKYKITNYSLEDDKSNNTIIINKDDSAKYNLKKHLLRRNLNFLQNEPIENELDFIVNNLNFKYIEYMHNKITKILNIPNNYPCAYCNPKQKTTRVCPNCKNLFEDFEYLQSLIKNDELDEVVLNIKTLDLKKEFRSIKSINAVKSRNAYLHKILSSLSQRLLELKQRTKNKKYYGELLQITVNLDTLREKCFKIK